VPASDTPAPTLLPLVALLALCAAAPRQAIVSLPVERASNVFFARATINGVGPFWFTVDTGATLTVIDPTTAARLGLATRPAGRRGIGVTGGETDMATTSGARIEIGGLPAFAPPSLFVVPVQSNAAYLGHQVDGVLGTDFLRRYVVRFDYGAGTVSVSAPAPVPADSHPSGVEFTLEGNVLLAPSTVTFTDGTSSTAMLLIDTGSNGALTLTTPFVKYHRLSERFRSQRASATVGISGMVFSPVITLGSVAFGQAVITEPNATLSTATAGLNASEDFDGIIGAELLRRFVVTIDYPRRRMEFAASQFRGSGFQVPRSGSGSSSGPGAKH